MIDLFDKVYNKVQDRNKTLARIKFYSLQRYLIRAVANILLPIYFNFTKQNRKYSLAKDINEKKKLIVSLTSFPQRINGVWLVVESLLRQSLKPDKIILWLSIDQFSHLSILPKKLLNQRSRGLEIKLVSDDLRSHKKYYYSVKEFPNDNVITVDDDVFYNSDLIYNLKKISDKFPNTICCNKAVIIQFENDMILPYITWNEIYKETNPSSNLMPIGIGGVLYPPKSLYKDVVNVELIKSLCFHADDIWLNAMARINKTKVAKTNYNSHFLPVMNKNDIALTTINVDNGENDIQLKAIKTFFISNYLIDPFKIKSL